MKKTILEWYEHLPEPIRSQAIENYDPSYGENVDVPDTLARSIMVGFFWSSSPQDDAYWDNIYERALNGEFDTPTESDLVKAARKVVEQRNVAEVCSDNLHYAIDELEKALK